MGDCVDNQCNGGFCACSDNSHCPAGFYCNTDTTECVDLPVEWHSPNAFTICSMYLECTLDFSNFGDDSTCSVELLKGGSSLTPAKTFTVPCDQINNVYSEFKPFNIFPATDYSLRITGDVSAEPVDTNQFTINIR